MRKIDLRMGGTRIVVLLYDYAIKFAFPVFFWRRFCYGCISNLEERYQWKNQVFLDNVNITSRGGSTEYAPTLYVFPFGLFSIQRRTVPHNKAIYDNSIDEHLRPCNTGTLNGRHVSFDYGVGPITIRKNKLRRLLINFKLLSL